MNIERELAEEIWWDEAVDVVSGFWTIAYPDDMNINGFILTSDFSQWCRNNLADHYEVSLGSIYCSTEDAVLLRLYMGKI